MQAACMDARRSSSGSGSGASAAAAAAARPVGRPNDLFVIFQRPIPRDRAPCTGAALPGARLAQRTAQGARLAGPRTGPFKAHVDWSAVHALHWRQSLCSPRCGDGGAPLGVKVCVPARCHVPKLHCLPRRLMQPQKVLSVCNDVLQGTGPANAAAGAASAGAGSR